MTRDARAYWSRLPAEAKPMNRAAEDFPHIQKRLAEIRAEEQRAWEPSTC